MAEADNRALVRRYVQEVWEEGDPTALERFLAPSYRRHLSPTSPPLDRDGQIQRLTGMRAAFPDLRLTVEDVVAEGDRVAFRGTVHGTHRGAFLGIPATGREVTVAVSDVVRIADGRIVEHWGGPDLFDLTRQLGADVVPPA